MHVQARTLLSLFCDENNSRVKEPLSKMNSLGRSETDYWPQKQLFEIVVGDRRIIGRSNTPAIPLAAVKICLKKQQRRANIVQPSQLAINFF